jgi:hypothetical protein
MEYLLTVFQINEPLFGTLTNGCWRAEVNEVRVLITCPSVGELLTQVTLSVDSVNCGQREMQRRQIFIIK